MSQTQTCEKVLKLFTSLGQRGMCALSKGYST